MWPAIIGAVGSIAGGALSGLFGNSQSNKSVRVQQEENEKNRQHNLRLAQMQNQWNLDLYHENNEYNSPANQRRLLREAGLNPDLLYSGNSFSPASAPALTSGEGSHGSVNPAIAPFDAAGAVSSTFDNAVKLAEAGLIKAQTRKVNAEGDIAISDAQIRDALNSGQLKLQGAQINFTDVQTSLTDSEIRKIQPIIDNLNAQTSELQQKVEESKATVANISADTLYKNIQNYFATPMFKAQINQMRSQTGLNDSQIKRTVLLMGAELLGIQAQTDEVISRMHLNNSQTSKTYLEGEYQMYKNNIISVDSANSIVKFQKANYTPLGRFLQVGIGWASLLGGIIQPLNPLNGIIQNSSK